MPLLVKVGDSTAGNYLAGRLAQKNRDYGNASKFLNHALLSDPENRDLLRRAFLASLAKGRFGQAGDLARRIVDQDDNASMANLVLLVGEISEGKFKRADERLSAMPRTGLNTFVVPLMRAWTLAGQEKIAEAHVALSPLGSIQGFAVLHNLHAGLIHDLGGDLVKAEERYRRATGTDHIVSDEEQHAAEEAAATETEATIAEIETEEAPEDTTAGTGDAESEKDAKDA